MQLIFGRILSSEIRKPGTFSIRTVRLISQLDNEAARLFQRLCSLSVSLYINPTDLLDVRVLYLDDHRNSNALIHYNLSFGDFNVLHEYGLIIPDYISKMNYEICIVDNPEHPRATLRYGNVHYGLLPLNKNEEIKELRLHGVAFTKAGRELLSVVPIEEDVLYGKNLEKFFNENHVQLVEVNSH